MSGSSCTLTSLSLYMYSHFSRPFWVAQSSHSMVISRWKSTFLFGSRLLSKNSSKSIPKGPGGSWKSYYNLALEVPECLYFYWSIKSLRLSLDSKGRRNSFYLLIGERHVHTGKEAMMAILNTSYHRQCHWKCGLIESAATGIWGWSLLWWVEELAVAVAR